MRTPLNYGINDGEVAIHHSDIPSNQTKIAQAVHGVLYPHIYTIGENDTIADLASKFGIHVPVSLFSVKPGQKWYVAGNLLVNDITWTRFPIRHATNDEQFAVAA